jgi:hypothetical protein
VSVVVQPDVGRLQVAVNDPAGVRVLEGAADVGGDPDRALHREPAALGRHQALDVAAGHVLADDEGIAVLLAGIENRDDVLMVSELAHRFSLALRPRLDGRGDPLGVEQCHGDLRARGRVLRQVDPLAATLAEEALDPVAACDLGRDVRGQGLRRRAVPCSLGLKLGST